jgi:hypothetical protein
MALWSCARRQVGYWQLRRRTAVSFASLIGTSMRFSLAHENSAPKFRVPENSEVRSSETASKFCDCGAVLPTYVTHPLPSPT